MQIPPTHSAHKMAAVVTMLLHWRLANQNRLPAAVIVAILFWQHSGGVHTVLCGADVY